MAGLQGLVARALDKDGLPPGSTGSHCLGCHISCKDKLRSLCANAEGYVAVAVCMHLHGTLLLTKVLYAHVQSSTSGTCQGGRHNSISC